MLKLTSDSYSLFFYYFFCDIAIIKEKFKLNYYINILKNYNLGEVYMKIYRKCLAIGLIILLVGVSFGTGGEPLSCDAYGPYEGNIMEDIEFDGTATGGIPPYEYLWDYGDGNSSSGDPHPTHNYANAGNYTVILTVTDSVNDTATDTTWAYINAPPNAPLITGRTNGKPGKEYEYTFNAIDPESDDVNYFIDWGDDDTEWTGFNASGTDVKVKHIWSENGTYNITAKALDTHDAEGPETTLTVTITIPRSRAAYHPLLLRLFERFQIFRYILGL